MYLLVADEAVHQQTDPTKFFVFGGILVHADQVATITSQIESIRNNYGFLYSDPFKFSPNDRPPQVSREEFIQAKVEVFRLAKATDVNFIGYAMLHAIGKNGSREQLIEWGADALLVKFQQFLNEKSDARGIALFDTLPVKHPNSYLRRAFQTRLQKTKTGHQLPNIDLIATVTDGCSPLTSVCDILVGSFNFCVNNPDKDKAGKTFMRDIKSLAWSKRENGRIYPLDRGILLRPSTVKVDSFKADYDELKRRLFEWMNTEKNER